MIIVFVKFLFWFIIRFGSTPTILNTVFENVIDRVFFCTPKAEVFVNRRSDMYIENNYVVVKETMCLHNMNHNITAGSESYENILSMMSLWGHK